MKAFIAAGVVAGLSALATAIAAEVTHIVVCLKTGAYLLLIAGAILPPVGIWHGVGVWFGAW